MRPVVTDISRDLLALTLIKGLGPVRIDRLIRACGSAQDALRAPLSMLQRIEGIGPSTARAIVESRAKTPDSVNKELDALGSIGGFVVTALDEDYPPLLRDLPGAPPVLRVRGTLDLGALIHSAAIVGSRSCTVYGSEQASRFATSLASAGLAVVSGGARGIDSAAHRATLRAGGQTVVVQGCGLGHVYPKENAKLFDEVVDAGGAIVSELPFTTPPSAENFPARNRIISGMSLGVLVIEAGRRSGALITARNAVEDHGREVFAVPGRVDSKSSEGSNELLKSGAHLVTEPAEVLEMLQRRVSTLEVRAAIRAEEPAADPDEPEAPIGSLSDDERKVLDALRDPKTGDELADAIGFDPSRIRAIATMLEIQGRIRRRGSKFERV